MKRILTFDDGKLVSISGTAPAKKRRAKKAPAKKRGAKKAPAKKRRAKKAPAKKRSSSGRFVKVR